MPNTRRPRRREAPPPNGRVAIPTWADGGDVHVIVETPKGCANKLKYEPTFSAFTLAKVLPAGMVFPYDFGFVPGTVGDDGDPLDVLLLIDAPVFPGCVVDARLIGVVEAEQRKGSPSRGSATTGCSLSPRCRRRTTTCAISGMWTTRSSGRSKRSSPSTSAWAATNSAFLDDRGRRSRHASCENNEV